MKRILLSFPDISLYCIAEHHKLTNKSHNSLCQTDILFLFMSFSFIRHIISLIVTFSVIQAILCAIILH
ncbi:hypothetical protein AYY16_17395 [Morganella psychrotolerans]|nr:hypothetical protein AYY16_17395 [Morganella psychrotolerans]